MLSQIIKILPDTVANQIAAGEVVQRPASVVKELLENSIDALAKNIKVIIKDGGKSLIQVIDDGIGMSEVDARLAFERHATSKISDANDLFSITTFGFRGEALASIASVAQVEMHTKRQEDELGTLVEIHGSKFIKQESTICNNGTNISVKNLFYNIPARRRFLKNDSIELKHITDEFIRIALSHPDLSLTLIHNQNEIFNLSPTTLKQRIIHIFGKQISSELLDLNVDTSIISISGFIGKPENAKKKNNTQFFFVNNRYIKHNLLYKVLINAYGNLLQPEYTPSFFIYFSCDPKSIDVNIHPTKTEIKFENERHVAQILEAAVKQTLGKTSILPNIDFDLETSIKIPPITPDKEIKTPTIRINNNYNPFNNEKTGQWKKLYEIEQYVEKQEKLFRNDTITEAQQEVKTNIIQVNNQYLVTSIKSGLLIINQHRAHVRILYEMLIKKYESEVTYSERLIFPYIVELSPVRYLLIDNIKPYLERLGFKIGKLESNKISVDEIPSFLENLSIGEIIELFFQHYETFEKIDSKEYIDKIIIPLAKSIAIQSGKPLSQDEMEQLVDELFQTSNPQYSPDGEKIFHIININEIEKLL